MRQRRWALRSAITLPGLIAMLLAGCSAPATTSASAPAASAQSAPAASPDKGGQDEFGPYELVENWPQPLPDGPDGVKHDGWTWGSVGAVYAETPDRIWIAQRGELPLPPGAKPWTPYRMLQTVPRQRHRQHRRPERDVRTRPTSAAGSGAGTTRSSSSIATARSSRTGRTSRRCSRETACGRGPHKIKMNPYDPEKHVWIIDDQQHVIWKFTYDGKLVMTLGTVGQARARRRQAVRSADRHRLAARRHVLHQRRLRRHARREVRQGRQVPDGLGRTAEGSEQSGAERVQHRPQHPDQQGSASSSSSIADIAASRSSTRTASSSTCSRPARNSSPYAHFITTDQMLWVSDGGTKRIMKYDLDGKFLYGVGPSRAASPGSSTDRTRSRSIRTATCIWPKSSTAAFRSSGRSRAPTRPSWSGRSFATRQERARRDRESGDLVMW